VIRRKQKQASVLYSLWNLRLRKSKIRYWHAVDQPDAILGAIKAKLIMHCAALHCQDDWLAMPLANLARRRHIWRKMHMLARAPQQTLFADRSQKALGRSMVQLR
jgi:hypothetical protein